MSFVNGLVIKYVVPLKTSSFSDNPRERCILKFHNYFETSRHLFFFFLKYFATFAKCIFFLTPFFPFLLLVYQNLGRSWKKFLSFEFYLCLSSSISLALELCFWFFFEWLKLFFQIITSDYCLCVCRIRKYHINTFSILVLLSTNFLVL
jgi:hypothetical protein